MTFSFCPTTTNPYLRLNFVGEPPVFVQLPKKSNVHYYMQSLSDNFSIVNKLKIMKPIEDEDTVEIQSGFNKRSLSDNQYRSRYHFLLMWWHIPIMYEFVNGDVETETKTPMTGVLLDFWMKEAYEFIAINLFE